MRASRRLNSAGELAVPADRRTIDLAQDAELWCRVFGVSPKELAEAVAVHGDSPDRIRAALDRDRVVRVRPVRGQLFESRARGLPQPGMMRRNSSD